MRAGRVVIKNVIFRCVVRNGWVWDMGAQAPFFPHEEKNCNFVTLCGSRSEDVSRHEELDALRASQIGDPVTNVA